MKETADSSTEILHSVTEHRDTSASEKGTVQAVQTGKSMAMPDPSLESESPTARLIAYNGIVEHIFFHPLIAYPQLAFDNDSLSEGYNDWFTTIPELKRILESLYKKGFILMSMENKVLD